ncbi:serine protein kinase, putative [Paecilomyces variotii No. 5]|uniref:Serine protein kinase, putative n=1 Tax=Byssochlamys spectabilis (strain No. 5 / NBRC 109023) TaxID=1356009 RepID=V5I0Z3_BYSSN|nr:serine protein kinase, putative [Paecilomyces variotii No. 5]
MDTFMTMLAALLSLTIAVASQQLVFQDIESQINQNNQVENNKRSLKFNFTSVAPHIFSSLHGLLQQWPNTFFPNGHSIVPCEIPSYTSLYHGRRDGDLPPSPEWFGFDVEMSYGIMGSDRNSHLLTYQTTRTVGCLYFDGESATLMGTGQMDSLNLFIYGNLTGPPGNGHWRGLFDEYSRATSICKWVEDRGLGGLGWGVEGVVRMNAGFEMIWCNFTSPSIRLMSKLNVTAPLLSNGLDLSSYRSSVFEGTEDIRTNKAETQPSNSYYPLPTETRNPGHSTDPPDPPRPPNWRRENQEPFLESQTWGWFESAIWHYGSSAMGPGRGETRVKPLTCGFLSFYSPEFAEQHLARFASEKLKLNLTEDGYWLGPGNNGTRERGLRELTIRRRSHLLHNISHSDASIMNQAAERALRNLPYGDHNDRYLNSTAGCSGMDWSNIAAEIVQRYAARLRRLRSILEAGTGLDTRNQTAFRQWTIMLRHNTHSLLVPYFEYPPDPRYTIDDTWSTSSALAHATLSRCQFHYTRLLAPDQISYLNPEEELLKSAMEDILGNICQTVVEVGFGAEREWFRHFDSVNGNIELDTQGMKISIIRWKEGVEELMAWLGWVDQWTGCDNRCRWDETCFIPMWPFMWLETGKASSRSGMDEEPPHFLPPGRGHPHYGHPGYGYGGRPGPGGHPPPFFQDDSQLWEPRCVKAGYML